MDLLGIFKVSRLFCSFLNRGKDLHAWLLTVLGLLKWRWRGVHMAAESALMWHLHKPKHPVESEPLDLKWTAGIRSDGFVLRKSRGGSEVSSAYDGATPTA